MNEIITITKAKARLSELISRLIYQKHKIVITKKGKKVAVMMPFEAYQNLEQRQSEGLILAQGVLADFDREIDEMCAAIYQARKEEKSRKVSL